MKEERINICYGISDKRGNYAKIMGTSICSVLENTDFPVTIHIFHDETLSIDNRCKLQKLIGEYRQESCFYDVSKKWKSIWEEIEKIISNPVYGGFRFTIGTFFRLLMGELLEKEKKTIYLDADTIVNMDINNLWRERIPASGMAAVPDIVLQHIPSQVVQKGMASQEEYFNAGVLLIDLDKYRSKGDIAKRSVEFLTENLLDDTDQGFLNYCFKHSAVLPEKYNCFVWRGKEEGEPKQGYIYHYVNRAIGVDMEDSFNRLYFSYFAKTPWCDEKFIVNLVKKIEATKDEYLNFANTCAGKRRIVIGGVSGKDIISSRFSLRDDDLYIPWENIEDVRLDFKKSKDVILIFLADGDAIVAMDRLISLGLVENIHFFDMFSMLGMSKKNRRGYEIFMAC